MCDYEKATLWEIKADRPVPTEMEIVGEWNGLPVYFRMERDLLTGQESYRHVVFNPDLPGGERFFHTEEEAWAWLCAGKDLRAWQTRWISDRIQSLSLLAQTEREEAEPEE